MQKGIMYKFSVEQMNRKINDGTITEEEADEYTEEEVREGERLGFNFYRFDTEHLTLFGSL